MMAVVYINDRAHGCVKMINAVQNSSLIDNSSWSRQCRVTCKRSGLVIGWMQSVIQLSQIPFTSWHPVWESDSRGMGEETDRDWIYDGVVEELGARANEK